MQDRYGIIYMATNLINNKKYIGQTKQSLLKRKRRHIQDATNGSPLLFHRAINKYGAENFKWEVLEDNILERELNKKESYWIKKMNSFYKENQGYNLTQGGNYFVQPKLSWESVQEIQKLLLFSSYSEIEIAQKFNASISQISEINTGRTWYVKTLTYPLRDHSEIDEIQFHLIVLLLKSNLFSCTQIAQFTNVSISSVSVINKGQYKKYLYEEIDFPLLKTKIAGAKLSIVDECYLCIDYLSGLFTRSELSKKYNISTAYVKLCYLKHIKYICPTVKLPLKDNVLYNKQEIMSTINKYYSYLGMIYGIV